MLRKKTYAGIFSKKKSLSSSKQPTPAKGSPAKSPQAAASTKASNAPTPLKRRPTTYKELYRPKPPRNPSGNIRYLQQRRKAVPELLVDDNRIIGDMDLIPDLSPIHRTKGDDTTFLIPSLHF